MKNKKCPYGSFPNYTREMYDGNEPAGDGCKMVDGGTAERWVTRYGGGQTYNGEILYFCFSLNSKVTIYIIGDTLNIVDLWRSADIHSRCYYNGGKSGRIVPSFNERLIHPLDPELIEKYLNTKIPDCKIWDMVQKRAKELFG